MNRISHFLLASLLPLLLLIGCASDGPEGQEKGKRLKILTTTGIIGDAVRNIVGDSAEVTSLMGAGVDPHLYKATQGDLGKLNDADIIFYNGLHLEGKLAEVLQKVAKKKPVFPVADGIPKELVKMADEANHVADPHIWFDVSLWEYAVKEISVKLQEADPDHAKFYSQNAENYINKLTSLHQEVKSTIKTIPKDRRVLVTAHDAFEYFGRAYDIEVNGLQGISTVSDFGLHDISKMVDMLVDRKIKAVFVESSVPRRSIEAVVQGCKARGHQIRIGATLYSDALGAAGTPEGEYIGMVRYNVRQIEDSLR